MRVTWADVADGAAVAARAVAAGKAAWAADRKQIRLKKIGRFLFIYVTQTIYDILMEGIFFFFLLLLLPNQYKK